MYVSCIPDMVRHHVHLVLPPRLVKEKNMYILEVEEQEAKVEQMQTDGKDFYVIKKQVLSANGLAHTNRHTLVHR